MYTCFNTQLAGSLYVHVILGMHYELQEVIYYVWLINYNNIKY